MGLTVDFLEDNIPPQSDHREAILALDIAVNDNGNKLYYGLEWCRRTNVVIVYDSSGLGWMRGKGGIRYGVMPVYSDISGPFPGLKSGKSG